MNVHVEDGNDREKNIKFMYNFIKDHPLAVVSTVTGSFEPQAGIVGFVVKENLEIVFGSFTSSRKYENLKKNPKVALVIGWEKGKTVQYEGTATEISDEEAEEELKNSLSKIPSIVKYLQREHRVLYKVTPIWVRFTNLSTDPWDRFAVKF